MELFRVIKKDAARAMRFCGGRAVASIMIVAMAYLAVNLTETILLFVFSGAESLYEDFYSFADISPEVIGITAAAALLFLLLMPALHLGYAKLHLAFAEGKDESIVTLFDMFSSFRKYFSSIFFSLCLAIRNLVVFALAMVPGGVLFYLSENYIPENTRTLQILKIAGCCASISIMIFGIAAAILFVQRWMLAPYYFVSGTGIHKSFALSAKAAKGLNSNIIAFKFSFIGWALLSFFVLPMLWSVPYYFLSSAIYSKYLMERYERSLAEIPESSSELHEEVISP